MNQLNLPIYELGTLHEEIRAIKLMLLKLNKYNEFLYPIDYMFDERLAKCLFKFQLYNNLPRTSKYDYLTHQTLIELI